MAWSGRSALALIVVVLVGGSGCTLGGQARVAPVTTPTPTVPTLSLPAPSAGPVDSPGSVTPLPARPSEPTPAPQTVTVTVTPPDAAVQPVPAAAASDCQLAGTTAASCAGAHAFLRAYFARDDAKNLTRAEIPNWFTAPANYYGQSFNFDQLTVALTTPSKPQVVYGPGRLSGFADNVPLGSAVGTQVTYTVPYTDHGVASTVQVRYTLVPGPGGQGWRITAIEEL